MKGNNRKINRHLVTGLLAGSIVITQGFWVGQVSASELLVKEAKIQSTVSEEKEQLIKINSYEELVKVLKENKIITKDKRYFMKPHNTQDVRFEASSDSSNREAAIKEDTNAVNYSTTNLQVEGVDEADTLKNDGRYIYQIVGNNKIAVVDTQGKLKTVSIIEADKEKRLTFNTMFLDNNKLIVIGERKQAEQPIKLEIPKQSGSLDTYYEKPYKEFGILQVYDLTDKSTPKLTREIEAEGSLNEVRKINQSVYMLTNKNNRHLLEDQFTEKDILPLYKDSLVSDAVVTMIPEKIWYQPWESAQHYTLITAMQLDEKKPIEVQGVLGSADKIYMNKEALYITSYRNTYINTDLTTYISKYNIDKQKVTYTVSGHVKGMPLNQFSMDEYKGNLRIATTDYSARANAVYILDNELKIIGQLENLAPGERIYSVRFTGEKGYVVTFKQVDPLFVIDLSTPKEPKVLGELKIPGFSQYLHPIGDHLVVGIGKSTSDIIRRDESGKETVTGVTTAGIKLSLFDVKDPMRPKEINHIILGVNGSYSGAAENHKMVTVHNQKQLLAIPIYIRYDQADNRENFIGAYVFGIKQGKLVGKAKLGKVNNQDSSYYNNAERVCYIGDKLYFLYDNKINEYELDTFSRIQTLKLD